MSKRLMLFLAVLVLGSILNLLVRAGVVKIFSSEEKKSPAEYADFMERVMLIIDRKYVDEVDNKKLLYGAISGMVSSLNDSHSSFISPEFYEHLEENTRGHFGGLGIVIGMKKGCLTVISTMEGTPAEKAGLESGDRILKISGRSTLGIDPEEAVQALRRGASPESLRELIGISLPQAVNELRGPVGEPITITVAKEGDEPRELTIERARIDVKSVVDVKIVEDSIGYIRLTNFGGETLAEMEDALSGLTEKGMQKLILDLRNNPGGLLHVAVNVADRFIPDGKIIVSARGRSEQKGFEQVARDGLPEKIIPMVVLVNEYSASGSEIVTAALKDWDCAIIVGQKTFGKGSVQNLIGMEDGSVLKLTTSRYYGPEGSVIDKVGVEPDISVEAVVEEGEEKKSEGEKEEIAKIDPELDRAVNILKNFEKFKKEVFGTGQKSSATAS